MLQSISFRLYTFCLINYAKVVGAAVQTELLKVIFKCNMTEAKGEWIEVSTHIPIWMVLILFNFGTT